MDISFDEIYSRYLSKVEAYDLTALVPNNANELMNEWLSSVKSNPRVRKLFSSLKLDKTNRILKCELKNSQVKEDEDEDEDTDKDFIIELFGIGIGWKWVTPKYLSVLNASQMLSGKEVSFYSQANHMAELEKMYKTSKLELYNTIRDYDVLYNSYLRSDS